MNIIEIKEEITIGDVILEKGDQIKVINESYSDNDYFNAFENLVDILEDSNNHAMVAVLHAMDVRDIGLFKQASANWIKRETQGYL